MQRKTKENVTHRMAMKEASALWPKEKAKILNRRKREERRKTKAALANKTVKTAPSKADSTPPQWKVCSKGKHPDKRRSGRSETPSRRNLGRNDSNPPVWHVKAAPLDGSHRPYTCGAIVKSSYAVIHYCATAVLWSKSMKIRSSTTALLRTHYCATAVGWVGCGHALLKYSTTGDIRLFTPPWSKKKWLYFNERIMIKYYQKYYLSRIK